LIKETNQAENRNFPLIGKSKIFLRLRFFLKLKKSHTFCLGIVKTQTPECAPTTGEQIRD